MNSQITSPDKLQELHADSFSGTLTDSRTTSANSPAPDSALLVPNLAVNQMTTLRGTFDEDVDLYLHAGVRTLGVYRPKLVAFGEERGADLLREAGMSVSTVAWAGGFTGSHGFSYNEAVEDGIEAIELAGMMDASCVLIASGARGLHTRRHARRLVVDGLKAMAVVAERHGVSLALVPMEHRVAHDWTFINSIEAAMDILAAVDHPAVQLGVDVYHSWREPDLLKQIRRWARHVATVQLSDWTAAFGPGNDRCMPGEGEIPLHDIISAFVEHGYRGDFELQIQSDRLWASDYRKLLRRCVSHFRALCPVIGVPA